MALQMQMNTTFANVYTPAKFHHDRMKNDRVDLSWFGCLTSQLTIFQLYMWRHIDVQADWRRSWTYGRAPNAIDIS